MSFLFGNTQSSHEPRSFGVVAGPKLASVARPRAATEGLLVPRAEAVPVLFNGSAREAEITYVSRRNFRYLADWRRCLKGNDYPKRRDAVDFATLACKRLTTHAPYEIYASSASDICALASEQPNVEVANLVEMRCGWFRPSEVIGVAHFRRTWCNNLVLDYSSK